MQESSLGGPMNALLVGHEFFRHQTLAIHLRRCGVRCDFADNLKDARRMLAANPFDLVLSNSILPDGTGLGLARKLAGQPVSVFVKLELGDSELWMPAIDHGRDCLGRASFSADDFSRILEEFADTLRIYSSHEMPPAETHESDLPRNRNKRTKHGTARKRESLVHA